MKPYTEVKVATYGGFIKDRLGKCSRKFDPICTGTEDVVKYFSSPNIFAAPGDFYLMIVSQERGISQGDFNVVFTVTDIQNRERAKKTMSELIDKIGLETRDHPNPSEVKKKVEERFMGLVRAYGLQVD